MKFRLPLIVLSLVVVPTTILSFLAVRSLKHDETLAQQRMETRARNAVHMASKSLSAELDNQLASVLSGLREGFFAGGELEQIQRAAERLEAMSPLIQRVYLFMNPWGFTWPEGVESETEVRREDIKNALRSQVSAALSRQERIAVTINGSTFLFAELGGRRQYYAGFQIDREGFAREAAKSIADAAGGGIMLSIDGGGLSLSSAEPGGAVVVVDSFGERSELGGTLSFAGEDVLVSEPLPVPFDQTVITAYMEDPLEFEQLGAVRIRLQTWGIVLLVAGIIAGVWLMIGTAQSEIRRARSGPDFAIGVSHDLRTPLAAMKVLAESIYLEHVQDPTKQKAFLGTIVSECDRLGLLIERVLYLVRFGQDAIRYHLTEANIETAVNEGVGAFLARFSNLSAADSEHPNHPAINVDIEPDLPPVKLDYSAFTQVLVNLLDNAVKYGRLGGIEGGVNSAPLITVSVRRETRRRWKWGAERTWVRLDVNDRGEGMEGDELKQIFRRFYRSERAGQLNLSGVGLGLSVCRHAAKAHGGWIEARSSRGEGSTFSVFFPVAG